MKMQEEQMKVLDMIAAGKITAQDGASLLEALGGARTSGRDGCSHHGEWFQHHNWEEHMPWKWIEKSPVLRIEVADSNTGQILVNLGLPIGMLKWREKFGKITKKFKNIVFDVANLDENAQGKIVETVDENSGRKVAVWIE
jgi:hypothetical protein